MTAVTSRQQTGLIFDGRGLMLGPLTIALREEGAGNERRYRIKPAAEMARVLRLAYGGSSEDVVVRCARSLQRVVDLLKAGDDAKAGVQVSDGYNWRACIFE